MFCPNCDSVLALPKKKKKGIPEGALICMDCDYVLEDESVTSTLIIKEEINHGETSQIEIVDFNDGGGISSDIREELTEQFREAIENFDT